MKNTRLSGHELLWEGAPYEKRANGAYTRAWGQGTGGTGYGRCSCGATSGELTSGTQRKRWHREHKDAIRAQAVQT